MDLLQVTCPRCGQTSDERFYGPCTTCRNDLRANLSLSCFQLATIPFHIMNASCAMAQHIEPT